MPRSGVRLNCQSAFRAALVLWLILPISKSKRTKQDRADESEDGADSQDIQFQGKLHKASLMLR
jgi:hypothetical protein